MSKDIIYVLMEDSDGTTFSRATPIGIAVKDESVAKAWVEKGSFAYSRKYKKVTVKDTV